MGLKDIIRDDIDAVFMDIDEFAEIHFIDGQETVCMIDEDKSTQNKNDGVYDVRRRLFVKQDDLGYRPVPEQKLMIDEQYFYVVDCLGDILLEIILEAHET